MYLRLSLILLPALLLADQVSLKNGDRVTGKIVKKDGDKVTVKSDLFGEVSIPWAAVTEIKSDEPLVVVLPGDKTVTGKVNTAAGKVEISGAAATESAPLADVTALRNADEQKKYERMLRPRLLELWAGYFDLGLALVRGNAHTSSFTTAFNAARASRTDTVKLYFNQIYATATVNGQTAASAEAVRGGWAYDRKIHGRLFANAFNDYEYDKFQNLDLRFVLGGGLGFNAVKNDRTTLGLLGGGDYDRDKFSTGLARNSAEAYFGDDWTYKLSGISSVTQSFRFFPNLTYTGEYRINFDLGASTTIRKWLAWQVTASDRFLSNPVMRRRNDVLLTTGFRVAFAR